MMRYETPEFTIFQLEIGPMENFSYLLISKKTKEAAVIDPAWDIKQILEIAEKEGARVTRAVLTHAHFDHANGLKELVKKINAKVYVHEKEARGIALPEGLLDPTKDEERVDFGGFEVEFFHTPGHTPGSQCLKAGKYLMTGDTLFVGACGRTDLPGGSEAVLFKSLQSLARLPEDTVVLPGHDYGSSPTSTIGNEKRHNPYFQCEDSEEFAGKE
jgi:hydroxyacylglutathione hydrolase